MDEVRFEAELRGARGGGHVAIEAAGAAIGDAVPVTMALDPDPRPGDP